MCRISCSNWLLLIKNIGLPSTTEQCFKEKSAHAFTFAYKAMLDQFKMGITYIGTCRSKLCTYCDYVECPNNKLKCQMPVIQSIKSPSLCRFSFLYQCIYLCLSIATITQLIGLSTLNSQCWFHNPCFYNSLLMFVSNAAFYISVVYNLLDMVVSVRVTFKVSGKEVVIYALSVRCDYTLKRTMLKNFAL